MIKTKVAFLEGRLLSSQSEQSDKFSKSPDWLEKNRPSKKPLLFDHVNRLNKKQNEKCFDISCPLLSNETKFIGKCAPFM